MINEESQIDMLKLQQIYKVKRFSAYLSFETRKSVQVKHIERGNMKFNRCQKALIDNSKDAFFSQDPILS